jgi:hypothetical protein
LTLEEEKNLRPSKPNLIAFEVKYSIYHPSIQKAGRKRDTRARAQIREFITDATQILNQHYAR